MCCSPTFWSCYLSSYSLNRQTLEIVSLPNFSISLDICFFTSRIQYSLFNFQVTVNLVKDSWWAQVDSNHRPHAYQACALTTWAMRPFGFQCLFVPLCSLPKVSLERWWRWGGSNSWPSACKADALPAELHPQLFLFQSAVSTASSKLNNIQDDPCWPKFKAVSLYTP